VLQRRTNINQTLKKKLEVSRHKMKQMTDRNRTKTEFSKGNWVFLKLQPYRQSSIAFRKNLKLNLRYYGAYQINKRIRKVACVLRLPEESLVHLVFHMSLLKKKIGDEAVTSSRLPVSDKEGRLKIILATMLDRKLMKKDNMAITMGLIQWSNLFP
jgi:hypothetical protein